MWTPAARVQLTRGSQPYATCLTDAEWALAEPFLPDPAHTGQPRSWPMRLLVDAVLYVLRKGCAWAHLPRDFPPPGTTHRWFLRLSRSGIFERLAHALIMADREASPTAAVLDAQSARSGGVGVKGVCGYDAGKKVTGRKRHALVDTDGRLLLAAVSPASLYDSRCGAALLAMSRRPWPFLARCFADRAYTGSRVAQASPVAITIVGSAPGQKGFAVQLRRWVVERPFAWFGRCRRLARDHEATVSSAVAFFNLAAAMIIVRRLAQQL
ncbi:IS5 family transposase [Roseomonas mucosa]|uniref:IS5 family transposase n=1 Tax=Roseomonas mucosa TaxID=207340 RepID=UPI0028CFB2CF|nr:IS5 family transposase [Roseomonas mucosa]MDT8278193.1 IS5 family transposase [Roseomonas mucosa]